MNELRSVHNNQTSKLEGWNNLKPVHARKHQFGAKGIEEILLKESFHIYDCCNENEEGNNGN